MVSVHVVPSHPKFDPSLVEVVGCTVVVVGCAELKNGIQQMSSLMLSEQNFERIFFLYQNFQSNFDV